MQDSARIDLARLRAAYEQVKGELLAERTPEGHWVGELSSSALATATAVSALAVVRVQGSGGRGRRSEVRGQERDHTPHTTHHSPLTYDPAFLDDLIARGVRYLKSQQNADGGFGDTDLSHSNIATTYLVVAALHLAGKADQYRELLAQADSYIDAKGRLNGLRERYGIDKTFVVPIMTNLALAGLLDWREIDPLPFELACVPQAWYRFVGMPVVSYAIPALVAIGQARYFHAPPRNPLTRFVRWLSISRSLKVLRRMQPDSGGYLEATPLTSFVVMSLASISKPRPLVGVNGHDATRRPATSKPRGSDQTESNATASPLSPRPMVGALNPIAAEVINHGVKFLAASIRPDGSWPIDTNLATWNTTLAINALAGAGEDVSELLGPACFDWLLSCQHTQRHSFTGADPGGFGWSDLSGAVPDADDTAGALLAIIALDNDGEFDLDREIREVGIVTDALRWLLKLQNRDGGWPTFCRGWGRLPFDRSGTDLTAHAVRAMNIWRLGIVSSGLGARRHECAHERALQFLRSKQCADGSWSPLWFGNQGHPTEDNPVYGTAKALFAYRDLGLMDSPEGRRGVAWLVANQNEDGGWGSGVWQKSQISDFRFQIGGKHAVPNLKSEIRNLKCSVEETALAVEALLAACTQYVEPRNAAEGVPYSAPEPRTLNPEPSVLRGLAWLVDRVERGEHRQPAPIGFYFAKLWYYERLYPLTFTVAALGRACREYSCREDARPPATDSATDPASTGTTPWTTA